MKKTKTDYEKFKEANERVAEVEAEAEESQKPSARIRVMAADRIGKDSPTAIADNLSSFGVITALATISAILDYLDEQYEKENGRE